MRVIVARLRERKRIYDELGQAPIFKQSLWCGQMAQFSNGCALVC
jgi:hypothetical protein